MPKFSAFLLVFWGQSAIKEIVKKTAEKCAIDA